MNEANATLTVDLQGLALEEDSEGLRLSAYPDPGTGGDPWTIGFGHTGDDVYEGLTITKEQAIALLQRDIATAEDAVLHLVDVPLTQGQFNALVDFAFNCGAGNLKASTMLRLINQGRFDEADEQFQKWDKAAGKVLSGLHTRRLAEAAEFMDPDA